MDKITIEELADTLGLEEEQTEIIDLNQEIDAEGVDWVQEEGGIVYIRVGARLTEVTAEHAGHPKDRAIVVVQNGLEMQFPVKESLGFRFRDEDTKKPFETPYYMSDMIFNDE
ncbi:hypothetical protein C0584_01695 [Candidatus Parcubacteria bacterium]|nr:MAG: hypothetical protein C0584_01695 [Candidatus Parcubacteria bacterium]